MTKICHAHCPDEGGVFLAVLAAVLAAGLAVIVGQVLASLFWAIIAVASVLGAAGIAHLAYVLHRDRPGRLIPASAEQIRAADAALSGAVRAGDPGPACRIAAGDSASPAQPRRARAAPLTNQRPRPARCLSVPLAAASGTSRRPDRSWQLSVKLLNLLVRALQHRVIAHRRPEEDP